MYQGQELFHLLLLCAVSCLAANGTESQIQCTSTSEKELKFMLTSSRNATGHWIAQIQLEHGKSRSEQDGPYEVQIQHNTRLCEDTDPLVISGNVVGPVAVPTPPAEDYKYVPGLGFYKLYLTHKTWHDAKRTCKDEGTHLAIPNSKEEVIAMLEIFAHNLDIHEIEQWDNQAFIGINDLEGEGDFRTIFDQPLSSTGWTRWALHEPNNFDSNEDCVTLLRDGRLNDVSCRRELCFFCEKEL